MPTIRDVAKMAGVSTATVSHVINSSRHVNPETKQLVVDAIARLNYRPSAIARSLTTSITRTVGVLVADITNPFFAALVRGIEDRLSSQDYNLIVCNTDERRDKEARYLELLLTRRVDGILVAPTGLPQPLFQDVAAQNIPLVFIDRFPEEKHGPVVVMDNFRAGYDAAGYLIRLGHRQIAILARYPALSTVVGRIGGYRNALEHTGIPVDESLIRMIDSNVQAARDTALDLFRHRKRPTAVIATNLNMLLGILSAMHDLGLTCPDDLSIVAFDDQQWAPMFSPPLTVIRQPVSEMCDAAVSTLLKAMGHNGRSHAAYDTTTLPDVIVKAELIERASCKTIATEPQVKKGARIRSK